MSAPLNETVRLLHSVREGDESAHADLFVHLQKELKQLAQLERYRWHGNETLNATAILHEAYIKLTDGVTLTVKDRSHFLAVAGKAMRQVLLDYARRKGARKRGGDQVRVPIEDVSEAGLLINSSELLDITVAMEYLEKTYPDLAAVVECRFYSGMTIEEASDVLGIGTTTVKRRWAMAQSLLYDYINGDA